MFHQSYHVINMLGPILSSIVPVPGALLPQPSTSLKLLLLFNNIIENLVHERADCVVATKL